MSIYVNFEIPESPREFLKKFYSRLYNDKAHCVETYFDKECLKLQCYAERLRSFDDLYDLFTTYYPELTEKDLIELLASTVLRTKSNTPLYLHVANCSGIDRIRIYYYSDIESCIAYFNCSKYGSKYSWEQLFAMMGIMSKGAYRDYLKNLKIDENV